MSGDVVQWICSELSKLLGTDATEDVANYVLSIETPHELEEYMGDILDLSLAVNKAFVQELQCRRWQTSVDSGTRSKHQSSEGKVLSKKQNLQSKVGAGSASANGYSDKDSCGNKHPSTQTKDTVTCNGMPVNSMHSRRIDKDKGRSPKTKFVPLFSPEGNDRTVAIIPGRHVCECQAAKHALINNCLGCGRVVCAQEGSGPCFFCQTLVCSKSEQDVLLRNSKKSERLRDQLMKQTVVVNGSSEETSASGNDCVKEAVAFKDRLLEYDRSSAKRTHVVDDESDYYATDSNQWLRPKERESLQRKKEELHSKRHASRRDFKVTLDFAGRRVIEERGPTDSHVAPPSDDVRSDETASLPNPDDFQFDLANPSLRVPPPKFTPEGRTQPTRESYAVATRGVKNIRLQDSDLQVMSDEGFALSMHQPWASLLVAGIKMHEGRTWYSAHRGVLWIASTAKKPDPEEIKRMENFYRTRSDDANQSFEFPSSYPSGCLLGCVTVEDCLERSDYNEQYPDGESDSPYVFICSNPRQLLVKFPIQGKHKIYKLDKHVHQAAKNGLRR